MPDKIKTIEVSCEDWYHCIERKYKSYVHPLYNIFPQKRMYDIGLIGLEALILALELHNLDYKLENVQKHDINSDLWYWTSGDCYCADFRITTYMKMNFMECAEEIDFTFFKGIHTCSFVYSNKDQIKLGISGIREKIFLDVEPIITKLTGEVHENVQD